MRRRASSSRAWPSSTRRHESESWRSPRATRSTPSSSPPSRPRAVKGCRRRSRPSSPAGLAGSTTPNAPCSSMRPSSGVSSRGLPSPRSRTSLWTLRFRHCRVAASSIPPRPQNSPTTATASITSCSAIPPTRSLTKADRADLHERAAAWLDRDGPGDDALVGYHLEQSVGLSPRARRATPTNSPSQPENGWDGRRCAPGAGTTRLRRPVSFRGPRGCFRRGSCGLSCFASSRSRSASPDESRRRARARPSPMRAWRAASASRRESASTARSPGLRPVLGPAADVLAAAVEADRSPHHSRRRPRARPGLARRRKRPCLGVPLRGSGGGRTLRSCSSRYQSVLLCGCVHGLRRARPSQRAESGTGRSGGVRQTARGSSRRDGRGERHSCPRRACRAGGAFRRGAGTLRRSARHLRGTRRSPRRATRSRRRADCSSSGVPATSPPQPRLHGRARPHTSGSASPPTRAPGRLGLRSSCTGSATTKRPRPRSPRLAKRPSRTTSTCSSSGARPRRSSRRAKAARPRASGSATRLSAWPPPATRRSCSRMSGRRARKCCGSRAEPRSRRQRSAMPNRSSWPRAIPPESPGSAASSPQPPNGRGAPKGSLSDPDPRDLSRLRRYRRRSGNDASAWRTSFRAPTVERSPNGSVTAP